MYTVTVQQTGKNIEDMIIETEQKWNVLKAGVTNIAAESAEEMKNIIEQNRKRDKEVTISPSSVTGYSFEYTFKGKRTYIEREPKRYMRVLSRMGTGKKASLTDLIEMNIEVEDSELLQIGVGNIEKIEAGHKNPDYSGDTGQGWKLLEWGGLPARGKSVPGQFTDGSAKVGGGTARFIYQKGAGTRMTPKQVVHGIGFIQKAWDSAIMKINNLLGSL